jgi:cytidine deaminase
MEDKQLVAEALAARKRAYVPYSKFKVGAALLSDDHCIYHGCNIENASYGLTNCAERTAVFKAVSEGVSKIKALAVVGDTIEPISPCGACRQVIAEFCDVDTKIILANLNGNYVVKTIDELLPRYFSAKDFL